MIKQLYDTFKCWSDGGSVWIISDPHLGDADCKYMDPEWPEPVSYFEMLNKYVHKNDTLVCLGDLGDIDYLIWFKTVHCKRKVLLCGNHEKGRTNYEPYFDEIYEGPLFIGEKILLSHEPIYGLHFCLGINGHTHGSQGGAYEDLSGAAHYNVCSNCVGYKPINLKDILTECPVGKIDSIHRETIDIVIKRKEYLQGNFDYDLPYRICSECGEKMYEGFCIGDGDEYYCSDECLHKHYTEEEYEEMYENDEGYWTSWN